MKQKTSLNEFDLIKRYFKNLTSISKVALGIGDDAAVIPCPQKHQLVITQDTLISGRHFFADDSAADIAYKAVAINLSDLAAMGAAPKYLLLSLTLPQVDEKWLKQFSQSFAKICKKFQTALIGGDTTKGHLSITITAIGFIPDNKFITRSNAQHGDIIFVSRELGDAAYTLALKKKNKKISPELLKKLTRPNPEVILGRKLPGLANSCIDVSDGLLADLGHICESSHVGAKLDLNRIPLSSYLKKIPFNQALKFALTGGDDYALCFTVPKNKIHFVPKSCYRIGVIDKKISGISDSDQELLKYNTMGYKHF